jgi:hypothetical protein
VSQRGLNHLIGTAWKPTCPEKGQDPDVLSLQRESHQNQPGKSIYKTKCKAEPKLTFGFDQAPRYKNSCAGNRGTLSNSTEGNHTNPTCGKLLTKKQAPRQINGKNKRGWEGHRLRDTSTNATCRSSWDLGRNQPTVKAH